MNNLSIEIPAKLSSLPVKKRIFYWVSGGLLLVYMLANQTMQHFLPLQATLDQSIWLLVLLSLVCFMGITGLCWWLLQQFWTSMGLPSLNHLISNFNTLSTCEQLKFYCYCFSALLASAVGCLIAIC